MPATDKSIPELTKDVAFHLGDMFRKELKLARVEATESARSLSGGFTLTVSAFVAGAASFTLLLFGFAFALSLYVQMWAAALIAAATGGLITLVLALCARSAFKAKDLSLPRTREQVSRDFRNISEHLH